MERAPVAEAKRFDPENGDAADLRADQEAPDPGPMAPVDQGSPPRSSHVRRRALVVGRQRVAAGDAPRGGGPARRRRGPRGRPRTLPRRDLPAQAHQRFTGRRCPPDALPPQPRRDQPRPQRQGPARAGADGSGPDAGQGSADAARLRQLQGRRREDHDLPDDGQRAGAPAARSDHLAGGQSAPWDVQVPCAHVP